MKEEKKKTTWEKTRGLFNTIHLWLGIASGLILFVVCLSGTVYTFSTEIQKAVDSDRYTVATPEGENKLPVDTLISRLLASEKGSYVQSVVIPENLNGSYQITLGKKEQAKPSEEKSRPGQVKENEKKGSKEAAQKGPPRQRGTTYFINPYTGENLGSGETSSSKFFMFMFRLHRWLLLDMEIGRPIVGVATLIFVVIILTGLVIWFPKKVKNWRQGLGIKTSGNWKRINHDLHSSLGLYSSVFLLVMALTGLTWSFEWYKTGFTNMFTPPGKDGQEKLTSMLAADVKRPAFEFFLTSANDALPYSGDYRVMLPTDSTGVVTVMKTSNTFFATSVADRITLDQYSAKVLKKELFRDKSFNEKVLASIKALHIGSFYGTFSKIIYFIACLIATSLPVTGVVIWINKLRKKKKKGAKQEMKTEVAVM